MILDLQYSRVYGVLVLVQVQVPLATVESTVFAVPRSIYFTVLVQVQYEYGVLYTNQHSIKQRSNDERRCQMPSPESCPALTGRGRTKDRRHERREERGETRRRRSHFYFRSLQNLGLLNVALRRLRTEKIAEACQCSVPVMLNEARTSNQIRIAA